MRGSMSWNETVKAAALAALVERTPPDARISVDAPWTWNPHDVWLSRASARRFEWDGSAREAGELPVRITDQ